MVEGVPIRGSGSAGAVRVVVSGDGALAALVECDRIIVTRLPGLEPESEIGIEGDAGTNEVAFVGSPARLVVLTHVHTRACLHVIDPAVPRKLSELQFVTPMRIAAVAGPHILFVSGAATAIVDISKEDLVVAQLRSRVAIGAAGAFGADRFLLCAGGVFEEWDAPTGAPARRFRLHEPVAAQHLGGDHRRIWWISRAHPERLEQISLIGSRQPEAMTLPEPAERIAADPSGELLVMVGSRTGCGFVIDLNQRGSAVAHAVTALGRGRIDDAVWQTGGSALVIGTAGRALELVPWPARLRAVTGDERADASAGGDVDAPVTPRSSSMPPASRAPAQPAAAPASAPIAEPRTAGVMERLAAWQQHGRPPLAQAAKRADTAEPAPVAEPPRPRRVMPPSLGWREAVTAWSRGVLAGSRKGGSPPVRAGDPFATIAARLGLDGELTRALYLTYGARLAGHDSIAPFDLASVIGGRWDEALGGGRLAASGTLVWRRSRVRLARVVAAALDELAPRTGTVVSGDPGTAAVAAVSGEAGTATAVAVVAPATLDLARVATWTAAVAGALLVPGPDGDPCSRAFLLEARVRGVTPLVRWPRPGALPSPVVLLVDDDAHIAGLKIPVIARWQPADSR